MVRHLTTCPSSSHAIFIEGYVLKPMFNAKAAPPHMQILSKLKLFENKTF